MSDQKHLEEKINKYMSDTWERLKQCESLIKQYTVQKKEYEDDLLFGHTLYNEKIGGEWKPPKTQDR